MAWSEKAAGDIGLLPFRAKDAPSTTRLLVKQKLKSRHLAENLENLPFEEYRAPSKRKFVREWSLYAGAKNKHSGRRKYAGGGVNSGGFEDEQ